ncbi:Rab family GTPase [Entamoeba marina]
MSEPKIKVVMVGDYNTGKTCMLLRLSEDFFDYEHNATIGASFINQNIELPNGDAAELSIWDTSGDERFRSVTPVYFRNAHVAIVVYDVTRKDSFDNIPYWIDLARKSGGDNIQIVIVGCKCDLQKEVSDEIAQTYCDKEGYPLVICSSFSGENVVAVFQTAAEVSKNYSGPELEGVELVESDASANSLCC